MSRHTFYAAVFLALFASLPLAAQPEPTNMRVQRAVRAAVLKTGEDAVILGSWVAEKNLNYKDPLKLATGGSDADMRVRLPKGVSRDEALQRWKAFRREVATAVEAEFGRDASRMLSTMNVYPPGELMAGVEDSVDALSRFRELGTVPNLSFNGSTNRPLNPALVEGLYGHGSVAWTQDYERTSAKLFFVEKNRVFTGTAELVNLIDGPQKFTAGGLGHTAEQWAEHGTEALRVRDGRLVEKYLGRAERDLSASMRLAQLETSGEWRQELQALRKELAENPRALARLEPRITAALRLATRTSQVLARLDTASGVQRAVLKGFLRIAEDTRNAPTVVTDALLKVPWSRLLETAMLGVAAAEVSKAVAERDLVKALGAASPVLLSMGTASLTLLAQEILTQARAGGYDLVAGYQDAFDLLGGLISVKGFEDAGVEARTVSLDRLAERFREGQEKALRNVIFTLSSNAMTKNGKVDPGARDATYARCMPVLLKAWQDRREQWRREALALKASYGTVPFRLFYEPVPVPFEAAKGNALATVQYGFERGSDDRLDRLRSLLKKLFGPTAYADPVVVWDGGSPGRGLTTSRVFAFQRPGTYTVSAVRTLRVGGWSAGGGGLIAEQEIRQTGFVDVDVVAAMPGVRPPTPVAKPDVTPKVGPVSKPPLVTSSDASTRVPATGAWVLEKTEFVVEKVDAEFMRKSRPTESGADGSGSATSTTSGPPVTSWRMNIAWTPPPRVLVPGKEVAFTVTVSDAGSTANGAGFGSIGANCPSLSHVWYGPAAGFDLTAGVRSKSATKTYTPPKAKPGTILVIIADYGVFSRRQQFLYHYKFSLDGPTSSPLPPVTPPPVTAPPAAEVTVFDSMNTAGVANGPAVPARFTIGQPLVITSVMTYHWNDGRGTRAGTITLREAKGRTYGPWPAVGTPGQGGVPNVVWTCTPNVELPAGTYTIVDSELSTWSQNPESGGRGMAVVKGRDQ